MTRSIRRAVFALSPVACLLTGCAMNDRRPKLEPPAQLRTAAQRAASDLRAERVTFESSGVRIVGVLHGPAAISQGARRPAVLVVGPWLNVKEQVATNYARALADRGLTALVMDFRYWGESGGEPRQYESAGAKVADIHAAVRYLRARADVDPRQIHALGICFGAGHVIAASVRDGGIRSVATVAAWLHDRRSLLATFGAEEIERRYRVGREAQRAWETARRVDTVPAASATDRTAAMFGVDYYADASRGIVPEWTNAMATMSWPEWLDFDAVALAPRFTAPLLMVHSDGSALPENARRFHAGAKGPKDLYWTEGNHTDFYDRAPFVARASDAVAAHFHRVVHAND